MAAPLFLSIGLSEGLTGVFHVSGCSLRIVAEMAGWSAWFGLSNRLLFFANGTYACKIWSSMPVSGNISGVILVSESDLSSSH